MSRAPVSRLHALSHSRRCYNGGDTVARSTLPRFCPMARQLALSCTVLLLGIKPILPLAKPGPPATVSLLIADTACATYKSP